MIQPCKAQLFIFAWTDDWQKKWGQKNDEDRLTATGISWRTFPAFIVSALS
jgi:hypothetical protein